MDAAAGGNNSGPQGIGGWLTSAAASIPGAITIAGFAGQEATTYALGAAALAFGKSTHNAQVTSFANQVLNDQTMFDEILLTNPNAVVKASQAIISGNPQPFIALFLQANAAAQPSSSPPPTQPISTSPSRVQSSGAIGRSSAAVGQTKIGLAGTQTFISHSAGPTLNAANVPTATGAPPAAQSKTTLYVTLALGAAAAAYLIFAE